MFIRAFLETMENRVHPITLLIQKVYHRSNSIIPQVGDIVNIFEDKQPRQKWLLGGIIESISRKDILVRAAKTYIEKTIRAIKRPITKLYPVEYNDEIKRKKKMR